MSANLVNQGRAHLPKRVLLLLTARTYRAGPFLEAAQRLDIEVVKGIDMVEPLAEYWHVPLGIDFRDPEGAVESIVAYAKNRPLGAIVSVDDSGSFIAAEASQALGLPHNSPEAAVAARDKYVMRQLLAQAGVQAPSAILHHFDQSSNSNTLATVAESVSYPCVLKPLTLSGSRGVIRANNSREFALAAHRLERLLRELDPEPGPLPFLVEQFIPGLEVALEALLDGGRLRLLALFDKPDPLDGPYFEETIYVTPSRLPAESQQAIVDCATRAAAALGLREGPVHAELRLNDDGPWLIELAGRSIGGLCSQTLRFGTDSTLEELILRQAFGLDVRSLEREDLAGGVMMIPIPGAGLLKRVDGCDAAERVPYVESIQITAKLNYTLTPLPEGDSYLGFIFAHGPSPEGVEQALRQAHSLLHFEIAPQLPVIGGPGLGQ
jgi:biotin carboxylase